MVRLLSFDSIPERDKKKVPEFHRIIESPAWIDTNMLLIINKLRRVNPEIDSNEANRANLAALKTLSELVDWSYCVSENQKQPESSEDELPED